MAHPETAWLLPSSWVTWVHDQLLKPSILNSHRSFNPSNLGSAVWKLLSQGEVTYPPEGVNAEKGTPLTSNPVVFTNNEHVLSFAPILIEAIRKKSAIDYPEITSLVVQCHLNNLYMPDEWRALVSEVEGQITVSPFREILIFDVTTELTTPLITYTR